MATWSTASSSSRRIKNCRQICKKTRESKGRSRRLPGGAICRQKNGTIRITTREYQLTARNLAKRSYTLQRNRSTRWSDTTPNRVHGVHDPIRPGSSCIPRIASFSSTAGRVGPSFNPAPLAPSSIRPLWNATFRRKLSATAMRRDPRSHGVHDT